MADNGGGGSGGNTSVIWQVWQGRKLYPDEPTQGTGGGAPGPGEYKVHKKRVTGHSNSKFDDIGKPDHEKLFKVILRFRDEDWDKLVKPEEKAWIMQRAKQNGDSLYLEIHVPAIYRPPPKGDDEWDDMPWEIQWEW
jgi:hypothetical protein